MAEGFHIADGFIEVHGDNAPFERDVDRTLRDSRGRFVSAGTASGQDFGQGVRDGSAPGLNEFQRGMDGRLRDTRGRFVSEGRAAGDGFGRGVDEGSNSGIKKFKKNVDDAGKSMAGFRIVAMGMGWGAIIAGALGAANSILSLTAALAPAAGIIAGLPAVVLSAGAALATFKIATLGVSDAFKAALSGNVKKFEKDIKNLSPAAREVAIEFKNLVPQFHAVRVAVQDALFKPLEGQLTSVARAMMGPMKEGLTNIARGFSDAALQVVGFLKEAKTVEGTKVGMAQVGSAIRNMAPAIQPVLRGFRDFAVVVMPIVTRLANSVGEVGKRFGEWMQKMAASGQATAWVQNALAVFKQLAQLLGSLGGIIRSVFSAITATGGNALGMINQMVQQVNVFLKTPEGKDALITLFRALGQLGQILMPVLQGIGKLVVALAPGFKALVDGLTLGFKALVPVMPTLGKAISDVAIALAPFLPMLGELLADLAPLLPPIAQLAGVLLKALHDILMPLMPLFKQWAILLGGQLTKGVDELSKVMKPLIPVIVDFVTKFGKEFFDAMVKNAPVMMDLAKQFLQLIPAILPVVKLVGELLIVLLPIVAAFLRFYYTIDGFVIKVVVKLVGVIAGLVVGIVGGIGKAISWLSTALPAAWNAVYSVVSTVVGAIKNAIVTAWNFIAGITSSVWNGIYGGISNILNMISNIFSSIWNFITTIISTTWDVIHAIIFGKMSDVQKAISDQMNKISAAWNKVWNAIKTFISTVWNAILSVISSAIMGVSRALVAGWNGITSGVTTAWNAIKNFFTSTWNSITSGISTAVKNIGKWIGDAWNTVKDMTTKAWNAVKTAVSNTVTSLLGIVKNIPGNVKNALGNLGNLLYNAGKAIIQGMINGIKSMAQAAVNAVKGVLSAASNLIPHSPAKEGPFSGKGWTLYSGQAIVEGLVQGLVSRQDALKTAVNNTMLNAQSGLGTSTISGSGSIGGLSGSFNATIDKGTATATGGIQIDNLTIKLDANIDLSKGVPRELTTNIRDALRDLEREFK